MQTNHKGCGFDIAVLNPQLVKKLQIMFIQNNEVVILMLAIRLVLVYCSQWSDTCCKDW